MTEFSAAAKLCECGCGTPVSIAKSTDRRAGTVKGQPVRFRQGHATRGIQFERKHPCIGFDGSPCENLTTKLGSRCEKCAHKHYLAVNRERDRPRNEARVRTHYQANRDEYIKRARQWKLDNPERAAQSNKQSTERRRDKVRAASSRWNRENPEAMQAARDRRRMRVNIEMPALDRELSAAYRQAIAGDPCFYCGAPGEENDHYQSLKADGTDHWWNLVRACLSCNRRKQAMHGDDFLDLLRSQQLS